MKNTSKFRFNGTPLSKKENFKPHKKTASLLSMKMKKQKLELSTPIKMAATTAKGKS